MSKNRLTPDECSNDMFSVDPFANWKDDMDADEERKYERERKKRVRRKPYGINESKSHLIIGKDND